MTGTSAAKARDNPNINSEEPMAGTSWEDVPDGNSGTDSSIWPGTPVPESEPASSEDESESEWIEFMNSADTDEPQNSSGSDGPALDSMLISLAPGHEPHELIPAAGGSNSYAMR